MIYFFLFEHPSVKFLFATSVKNGFIRGINLILIFQILSNNIHLETTLQIRIFLIGNNEINYWKKVCDKKLIDFPNNNTAKEEVSYLLYTN